MVECKPLRKKRPMTGPVVQWIEIRPDDFRARRDCCPIVYLPLGLCDPCLYGATVGLDLVKAQYYCEEAARRFGGIVAPSQGYHILPQRVLLPVFLCQLRAFARAGFSAALVISGHLGRRQNELRRAAAAFQACSGLVVVVKTDLEWAFGQFCGSHAARYETSQLMAIRPDLVDLSLSDRQLSPGSGGILTLGTSVMEANLREGIAINEALIAAIGRTVAELSGSFSSDQVHAPDDSMVESIWTEILETCPASERCDSQ